MLIINERKIVMNLYLVQNINKRAAKIILRVWLCYIIDLIKNGFQWRSTLSTPVKGVQINITQTPFLITFKIYSHTKFRYTLLTRLAVTCAKKRETCLYWTVLNWTKYALISLIWLKIKRKPHINPRRRRQYLEWQCMTIDKQLNWKTQYKFQINPL